MGKSHIEDQGYPATQTSLFNLVNYYGVVFTLHEACVVFSGMLHGEIVAKVAFIFWYFAN